MQWRRNGGGKVVVGDIESKHYFITPDQVYVKASQYVEQVEVLSYNNVLSPTSLFMTDFNSSCFLLIANLVSL